LAIAGVRLLIYGSGNAPAADRGGIRDLVIVAEADRDLKQLRSRLSPTGRLAVLLADTPADRPRRGREARRVPAQQRPERNKAPHSRR
jgi:hypothetical protein